MRDGFSIVYSFRNRLDVLNDSIVSAHETCPKEVDIYMVDAASTDETIIGLRSVASRLASERKIRICETTYRTTIVEAWNIGMMLTDTRYVIFASSDVKFLKPGWFEIIRDSIKSGNQYVLLDNHAVFGFDKKAIQKMGWIDEQFGNGPHFDCDMMIRASENGVKIDYIPNNGFYHHADTYDEVKNRLLGKECENRLPMNGFDNEEHFNRKWASSWPGWSPTIIELSKNPSMQFNGLPHPPTNIGAVKRKANEIDPHPFYTKKMGA